MHDSDSLRSANRYLSRLIAGREDRLMGFAVINPGTRQGVRGFAHRL